MKVLVQVKLQALPKRPCYFSLWCVKSVCILLKHHRLTVTGRSSSLWKSNLGHWEKSEGFKGCVNFSDTCASAPAEDKSIVFSGCPFFCLTCSSEHLQKNAINLEKSISQFGFSDKTVCILRDQKSKVKVASHQTNACVSRRLWGNFFKFGKNINFDLRSWFDSYGGWSKVKVTVAC